MILILGGTTEGRIAVETLEEAGQPYYYSTRGDEQDVALHHGTRLQGALSEDDMATLCSAQGIRLIVDAAHPFATMLHHTVARVAERLGLPVVRLERIYPPRDEQRITWVDDYGEAMTVIKQTGAKRLLALTGVQSIAKLRPLWQGTDCECHFRILPRESSIRIAHQAGFPDDRIHYYNADEADDRLMRSLRPDTILLKESGQTGGFAGKAKAAIELGIRVVALRRPAMPAAFHTIDGRHGLRRKVEQLLPEFFALHSGLTTGTCATAASVAATARLLGTALTNARVTLPSGETIEVEVDHTAIIDSPTPTAMASVIKDAGDDPDITNGMAICAMVTMEPTTTAGADYDISLTGGEGIGTVTLTGLGLPVGGPAINETPRHMIVTNVEAYLHNHGIAPGKSRIAITLSIPGGEEAARRTFNPRIGVVGGLSVIGTSGIVKPFSSEAFVDAIRKSMQVARATGSPLIVINSGAKSERFLRALHPTLPLQAFVHYGNFIGETLKIAEQAGIRRVTMGLMIGKAVKLAEGHLDTHSKHTTMNLPFVCNVAREAGCTDEQVDRIGHVGMAREIWDILPEAETRRFCRVLTDRCLQHCRPLLPGGELCILLVADDGRIPLIDQYKP